MFVCVEVLWPCQPNGVMLSAVSLPNHTVTGQTWSFKWLFSNMHILSPETDNCPFLNKWEGMTVGNISRAKCVLRGLHKNQTLNCHSL